MNDLILETIMLMFGEEEAMKPFENELLININSSVSILNQIGVGPTEGIIIDKDSKWNDLIGESKILEFVKMFMYIDSKISFDPPSNAFLMQALEKQREELIFRIYIQKKGGQHAYV